MALEDVPDPARRAIGAEDPPPADPADRPAPLRVRMAATSALAALVLGGIIALPGISSAPPAPRPVADLALLARAEHRSPGGGNDGLGPGPSDHLAEEVDAPGLEPPDRGIPATPPPPADPLVSGPGLSFTDDEGGLVWPVRDAVTTSGFGYRWHPVTGTWKLHRGIDLGAACGTPVYAAAAGTVALAQNRAVSGNAVVIDHGALGSAGHEFMTMYYHLEAFAVRAGDTVERGQLVGLIGTTGRSTGCHLHWGLTVDGAYVDPALVMRAGSADDVDYSGDATETWRPSPDDAWGGSSRAPKSSRPPASEPAPTPDPAQPASPAAPDPRTPRPAAQPSAPAPALRPTAPPDAPKTPAKPAPAPTADPTGTAKPSPTPTSKPTTNPSPPAPAAPAPTPMPDTPAPTPKPDAPKPTPKPEAPAPSPEPAPKPAPAPEPSSPPTAPASPEPTAPPTAPAELPGARVPTTP